MGKRKRISKRHLRQDKLVETTAKGTKYLEHHTNTILIGLLIALVAVVLTTMIVRGQRSTDTTARGALAIATQSLNARQHTQAQGQLEALVSEYPGTTSAGAAVCYLGAIFFYQGDLDAALAQFDTYLDQYRNSGQMERVAIEGKAAILEQRNQFPEAAALYEDLINKTRNEGYTKARHLANASRCYRAMHDWASLQRAADDIIQNHSDTPYTSRAQTDLAEATARLNSATSMG